MMRSKKLSFWLFLVLALATCLRFFAIGKFPTGFTADEAAQGYTAYSILKTGRDEWGKFLPLAPRSFGDFKPPLYTYLSILPISLFGLNESAVRLAGALLGVLAVWAAYLLSREIFGSEKWGEALAIVSAFLLAISPWHIPLSRGAFEAAIGCFFIPMGLFFFLKAIKDPGYWWGAAIFFGLSLLTYHSTRLFVPPFVILLALWASKKILSKKKFPTWPTVLFSTFLMLFIASFLVGGGSRVSDLSVFSGGLINGSKVFVSNYLSYFSPEFLFLRGAGEGTYGMIPGYGTIYVLELPFLLFAIYKSIRDGNSRLFPIFLWLLLAPIPGSLSSGVGYHANRVAIMMPAMQILSAYGFISVVFLLKKSWQFIFIGVGLLLFFVQLSGFCYKYFFLSPKSNAAAMAYGWEEATAFIKANEENYDEILISRRFSEPQAMIMFYGKYDPVLMHKETRAWMAYTQKGLFFVDQLGEYRLGKYRFQAIEYSRDIELKKTLLVGGPDEFPKSVLPRKVIYYPSGLPAILMVDSEGGGPK